MTPLVNVVVIIVNYRSADLTIGALASLERELERVAPAQVVVVDNDSPDDSFERLSATVVERGWSDWVSVFASGHNGGFAMGNNFGLARADERWGPARYVYWLNPDTVVRPFAVVELVGFLERHPDVGIVGSRLVDERGIPQHSAFRFPSVLGELEASACIGPLSRLLDRWVIAPPIPDAPTQCDWVSGASMMVRRELLDTVGSLDERYFMYFEEVDLMLRARRAGWSCWYVPASEVVHYAGQSSGVTDPRRGRRRRPGYWFESRRRYMLTHLGRPQAVLADVALTLGHVVMRSRCFIEGRSAESPEHFLRDLARHALRLDTR